jgi:hypothetical protein
LKSIRTKCKNLCLILFSKNGGECVYKKTDKEGQNSAKFGKIRKNPEKPEIQNAIPSSFDAQNMGIYYECDFHKPLH